MFYGVDGHALCARCPHPTTPIRATRGSRFGGSLVDSLVTGAGVFAAWGITTAVLDPSVGPDMRFSLIALVGVTLTGIAQGMSVFTDPFRRSIGKRVAKTRVARPDGRVPEIWRLILLRNVVLFAAQFIPFIGNFVGFADAVTIFGADVRCLHDYIADTIVVDYVPGETPRT